MFGRYKYKRLDNEEPLVRHLGIFRRKMTLFQAVALIISATIGAGVLGIPYAVAKIGIWPGLAYVVILGCLMMALNLMIGEVMVRTKGNLQIVGLAGKYLGRWGEILLSIFVYIMLLGTLVIYTIGSGEALSALFGGTAFNWSLIFMTVGAFFIFLGMKSIKVVEFLLSIGILFVIILIILVSAPHVNYSHFAHYDWAHLLFPYGVILFAFHATTSIPEAHSLLGKKNVDFKLAILIAGIISIIVYALFAVFVVAVTGPETTEIATIGLGQKVGRSIFLFGNIFAVLAMGTSFLINGMALKDSLCWDYKLPNWLSYSLVIGLPLVIFIAGIRNFIAAIDIVGGVFVSLEMLMILLIYWRAKQKGDLSPGKYKLHHTALLGVLLFLALAVGAVYSVVKLF
ncbi:MAG: aromatic amino acid transport family protein [Candidatus Magasanikbacteria bacterium]